MSIYRQPAITHVGAAEIRVFPREPGTDDASDMYVMEVLGTTVLVRLVRSDDGDPDFPPQTRAKIMVEASGVFVVGINDDENVYGDAADTGMS